MILGRPLTARERRRSQRLYCAFNFVNGVSYMCLGESLLVLFAAQLGAPNAVVSLLGAMQYIGYAMLPLGVRRTARRGAAASEADFWIARNVAALVTASAAPIWLFSAPVAWALLLLGALLFYGFRAAGCVLFTPLLGDVSSEEEAAGVIGRTTGFFNVSAVVTLAAITWAMHGWHGREALATIIVIGAMLGMCSSFFVRGMRETGAIRDAARAPLWHGMVKSLRDAGMRRLVIAWFFLNLVVIMLVPISMLALKRGCGFDDGKALICACAQFTGGIIASFACGPLCRRFGVRRVLTVSALGCATVPVAWMAFPASGCASGPALWAGLALFFWLGTLFYLIYNATNAAFLIVCPDKKDQVAGSIAANLFAGAGAGIVGSALGAWLVSRAMEWAPALGAASFAIPLGPFRLYFLLLLPVVAAAGAAAASSTGGTAQYQF